MALPLPRGLVPSEVAFLCEMELVTVVPRQRLDSIPLLGGNTPDLRPPHRALLPLWLALLLKRQRRARIVAPPWLHPASLRELVKLETRPDGGTSTNTDDLFGGSGASQMTALPGDESTSTTVLSFSAPPPVPVRADGHGHAHVFGHHHQQQTLSPPFLPSCTADSPGDYLPYHWAEFAEMLLVHAADDLPAPAGEIRGLLRDLTEARAAKLRALTRNFAGNNRDNNKNNSNRSGNNSGGAAAPPFLPVRGIGALELAEARSLVTAVHDGVRRLGAATEASRRDEEEAAVARRRHGYEDDDDSDEEMGI